eukprot:TRINITY_DN54500_c0_g1_i1.p1 TRINITY_DN54500_c0_g1~~TRINITY_DN54500_c0_g1_i1.p1  ORF type:complete len:298 (+),score=101.31 TRINITY_DN54500_c0_g1_i1:86-895(+)
MSAAAKAADEERALHALVAKHEDLEFVRGNTKVRCKSTGHDMPTRLQIVQDYINGAGYKKSREWYSQDFSKYEPYLVANKTNKKFLYCTLTGITLPMDPMKVERHANSKRFLEMKKQKEEETSKTDEKKAAKRAIIDKIRKDKGIVKKSAAEPADEAAEGPKSKKGKKRRRASAEDAPAAAPAADAAPAAKVAKASGASDAAAAAAAAPADAAGASAKKAKKRPERSVKLLRKKQHAEAKAASEAPAAPAPASAAAPGKAKKLKKKAAA